jgi:catechol 1,2-dioxygenase
VFAVKRSLVQEFVAVDDPGRAAEFGVANPFRLANFDIVLQAS